MTYEIRSVPRLEWQLLRGESAGVVRKVRGDRSRYRAGRRAR